MGAVAPASKANDRLTVDADTYELLEELFAEIVQVPVWPANTVTVAVEVPPLSVDEPTVHLPVVLDVKVTDSPEVAVAETVNVWFDEEVTMSAG